MSKAKNKLSLFEAVRAEKTDMYKTLWRIEANFNILNHMDLQEYCNKNGLELFETKEYFRELSFKIKKEPYFEKIKDTVFYQTATINKEEKFTNFGIHDKTAILYGKKITDIEMLKITIAENQEIGDGENYWGFLEYKDNNFNTINFHRNLVDISLMGGIKGSEESGRGFVAKINIELIDKKVMNHWWNNLEGKLLTKYASFLLDFETELSPQEVKENASEDEIKRIFNYWYLKTLEE